MLYTVGEMSKATGIPASTLRYYDNQGLLPFVERTPGGMRMFTDQDLATLRVVECLKSSGLSLAQIREFLQMVEEGDASLARRRELFEAQREAVRAQAQELQRTLEVLDYKCWYYKTAAAAGTEEAVRDLPAGKVPAAVRAGHDQLSGQWPEAGE